MTTPTEQELLETRRAVLIQLIAGINIEIARLKHQLNSANMQLSAAEQRLLEIERDNKTHTGWQFTDEWDSYDL